MAEVPEKLADFPTWRMRQRIERIAAGPDLAIVSSRQHAIRNTGRTRDAGKGEPVPGPELPEHLAYMTIQSRSTRVPGGVHGSVNGFSSGGFLGWEYGLVFRNLFHGCCLACTFVY